jgi:group I intron endonuclease
MGIRKRSKDISYPGIYLITNKINGKNYIGQSLNINTRWINYESLARRKKTDTLLLKAFAKYGIHNFDFKVLIFLPSSKELLNIYEITYIRLYCSYCGFGIGYNMTFGGGNPKPISEDTRNKLIKSHLGNKSGLGKRSLETRQRMSENHVYHSWNKGKTKENTPQMRNSGRKVGSPAPNRKRIINLDTKEEFASLTSAGYKYKCDPDSISKCCRGLKKTYKGYHWSFC